MQPSKKVIIVTVMAFLFCAGAMGQKNQIDQALEHQFLLRVKQVDEFMKRFNYEWSIDNKPLSYSPADSVRRKEYLLSLFDSDYLQAASLSERQKVADFIEAVENPASPFFLKFHRQEWYAEVSVKALYKGKETRLLLYFKTHLNPQQISSWKLASVWADFLDITPADTLSLTPISHEINFTKFVKEAESSPQNMASLADETFRPDQRNTFFFLLKNGELQLKESTTLACHFLAIPGWAFEVRHFERKEGNVGWLISQLHRFDSTEKSAYRKQRLFLPAP